MTEEKGEGIMKKQGPENKVENDKRMPEANFAYTLETCREEKLKQETRADISAKKKLLARDEGVSSPRLSEIINEQTNDSIKRTNDSIKHAVQTLVKCSMVSKMQVSTTYF